MRVFADGFLPLHVEVTAASGRVDDVRSQLRALKTPIRNGAFASLEAWVAEIESMRHVEEVVVEGPHASLLIPLRVAHSLSSCHATMSAVVGRGWAADAIEEGMQRSGVALRAARVEGADSPLEISVRDALGESASVKLYPGKRSLYRQRTLPDPSSLDILLTNRANKGLLTLAVSLQDRGMVSYRVRKRGRHDAERDTLEMIQNAHHVCVSARSGALREVASSMGIAAPRGWPKAPDDLWDEVAQALCTYKGGARLVMLVTEDTTQGVCAVPGACQRVRVDAGRWPRASRAARLQGVCVAFALERMQSKEPCIPDVAQLKSAAQGWLDEAFEGTQQRPWTYGGM